MAQAKLDYTAVSESLAKANSALIVLSQKPSIDSVAAGLALYLALIKQNKKAIIACASPLTVAYNRLFAVNKVVPEVGNKNLLISFPCTEDSLEKVSYNIDNNRFNLVIEQKEDKPQVDVGDIKYNYVGTKADLVIAVGVNKIEDLGSIYQNDTAFFAQAEIVNINTFPTGTLFGRMNIFDPQASSVSELMAELIKKSQLNIDADIATNLIAGIEVATGNLTYRATGNTFGILGWLMNIGGKRGNFNSPVMMSTGQTMDSSAWRPQTAPFGASMRQQAAPASYTGQAPSRPSVNLPVSNRTMNSANPANQKTVNDDILPGTEPSKEADGSIPRPDWFKPKIFKGKSKV